MVLLLSIKRDPLRPLDSASPRTYRNFFFSLHVSVEMIVKFDVRHPSQELVGKVPFL